MKEKGWSPFWAALLAALLVLLPLVGGTVLLTRRSLRTRLASRPQSGVAIRQPKEENRLSLLVCIAPTETTAPGFLLLYLNASQNCIHALALPGELTVPFGADEASLSDCYRAAGPARCREALLSALSLMIWREGDTPAKEIARQLTNELGWNVNTTYTLIKRCMKKGAIERSEPGFLCHALIPKSAVQEAETDELINKVYDGSADKLFAALLGRKKLSAEQIERLRQIVGELE